MRTLGQRLIGAGLSVALLASGCSNLDSAFSDEKNEKIDSEQAKVTIGLDGSEFVGYWELRAQSRLRDLALSAPDFNETLRVVYGEGYDRGAAESIRQQIIDKDFSWMPVAQLVPGSSMPGAAAAYSEIENRIYLNAAMSNTFVREFSYLEEVGHSLDTVLNQQDTVGDEGEAFMRYVFHIPAVNSLSPDHGTITVDGREILVEFGWLDDVWDAIQDGASWTWDKVESATEYVLGGIEDTWNYLKREVNWACVANGLLAVGGCGGCIAAAIAAAPETAGLTIVGAKEICGVVCVGAAIAAANECAGHGATTGNSTVPVASTEGHLSMSLATHPRSYVKMFDGNNRNGDWQAFPIGTWNADSFGYVGNDKVSSLQMTPGLIAKMC